MWYYLVLHKQKIQVFICRPPKPDLLRNRASKNKAFGGNARLLAYNKWNFSLFLSQTFAQQMLPCTTDVTWCPLWFRNDSVATAPPPTSGGLQCGIDVFLPVFNVYVLCMRNIKNPFLRFSGLMDSTSHTTRDKPGLSSSSKPKSSRRNGWNSSAWHCECLYLRWLQYDHQRSAPSCFSGWFRNHVKPSEVSLDSRHKEMMVSHGTDSRLKQY